MRLGDRIIRRVDGSSNSSSQRTSSDDVVSLNVSLVSPYFPALFAASLA
jgi:hypothetical protein